MDTSTMTPQAVQEMQLVQELARLTDRKFSDLEAKQQRTLAGHARDIANLRDDFKSVQSKYLDRFNAIAQGHARGGGYRGPFENIQQAKQFGELCIAIRENDRAKIQEIHTATMGPSSGSAGGNLLPDQFIPIILRNVEKYGVIERDAMGRPVSEQTGGEPKRLTGFTCAYPDLGVTPSATDLTTGRINFNLTRYQVYALADRWQLMSQNAAALGDYIVAEMGLALAYAEDLNAFMGDGTSTYAKVLGMFKRANSTQLTVTADTGDDTFAEVVAASVKYPTKAAGLLPDWTDDSAKWYMHRSIFWGFLGARDSQGRPVGDIIMADGRPQRMLCGYPVQVVQVAPKLADTAVSTVLAVLAALDRSHRLYRHQSRVELRMSEHYRFPQGETAFSLDCLQDIVEADDQGYVQLKTAAS